jgi:hypothetical protein
MTLDQLPSIIALAILLLAIFELVAWLNKQGWLDYTPGPRPQPHAAVCQWCPHRAGDLCTNPIRPVDGQECEPVCTGEICCWVREWRRRSP